MRSGALVRVVWAMSFVVPFAVAASPAPARACGSAIREVVDESIGMRVSKAEQALSEGRNARAALMLSQAFPNLRAIAVGTSPVADRALRALALAAVRTDGGITTAGVFRGTTPKDRAQNLEFAVDTLRKLNAKRLSNPSYLTDLGEALSKMPKHHVEALKVLGELADKDLVASAEGYASLAKLRGLAGDKAGREAAVKRCASMAKDAQICGESGGGDPS